MTLNNVKEILENQEYYHSNKTIEKFYIKKGFKIMYIFMLPIVILGAIILCLINGYSFKEIIGVFIIILASKYSVYFVLIAIIFMLHCFYMAFVPMVSINLETKKIQILKRSKISFQDLEEIYIIQRKWNLILVLSKGFFKNKILLDNLEESKKLLLILKTEFGDKLKIKE